MLVVGCWLLVVCCLRLAAVGCLLFVVCLVVVRCCLLSAVCSLLRGISRCASLAARRLVIVVFGLLFVVCFRNVECVACCWLFVACRLLFVKRCVMLFVCRCRLLLLVVVDCC